MEIVKNSKLPISHKNYKPLYCDRQYNIHNRKLHKIMAKTSWYDETELVRKTQWRHHVPVEWSGCKPVQYSLQGMKYTTLMQVPSSSGGRLLKMLAKAEPRLAKLTGYQTKYTEKSGRALSKFFPVPGSTNKCHRITCAVCSNTDCKGPTLCQVKSVVYTVVCTICDEKHRLQPESKHEGRYVGQTARTLSERAHEHLTGLRRVDLKCHLVKHWALSHPELTVPPKFKFSVVKPHKDPMSRMIHEAIKIIEQASMNSKSERSGYKIARLSVSPSEWELKKQIETIDNQDKVTRDELIKLKERVDLAKLVTKNNSDFCSRKRMAESLEAQAANKKLRGISTGRGAWSPAASKFVKNVKKDEILTSTPVDKSVKSAKCGPSESSVHSNESVTHGLSTDSSENSFLVAVLDLTERKENVAIKSFE